MPSVLAIAVKVFLVLPVASIIIDLTEGGTRSQQDSNIDKFQINGPRCFPNTLRYRCELKIAQVNSDNLIFVIVLIQGDRSAQHLDKGILVAVRRLNLLGNYIYEYQLLAILVRFQFESSLVSRITS